MGCKEFNNSISQLMIILNSKKDYLELIIKNLNNKENIC